MKRIHIGVVVKDFDKSLDFYTCLFGQGPTLIRDGYARWMLDDPRVNLNINVEGPGPGVDHLGIQVQSDEEVAEYGAALTNGGYLAKEDPDSNCGYAQQSKVWASDPQGVIWEAFHSKIALEQYGENDLPDELIAELRQGGA